MEELKIQDGNRTVGQKMSSSAEGGEAKEEEMQTGALLTIPSDRWTSISSIIPFSIVAVSKIQLPMILPRRGKIIKTRWANKPSAARRMAGLE